MELLGHAFYTLYFLGCIMCFVVCTQSLISGKCWKRLIKSSVIQKFQKKLLNFTKFQENFENNSKFGRVKTDEKLNKEKIWIIFQAIIGLLITDTPCLCRKHIHIQSKAISIFTFLPDLKRQRNCHNYFACILGYRILMLRWKRNMR